MTARTITYISLLGLVLVVLALGGWTARGVKALANRTRARSLRPRLV